MAVLLRFHVLLLIFKIYTFFNTYYLFVQIGFSYKMLIYDLYLDLDKYLSFTLSDIP